MGSKHIQANRVALVLLTKSPPCEVYFFMKWLIAFFVQQIKDGNEGLSIRAAKKVVCPRSLLKFRNGNIVPLYAFWLSSLQIKCHRYAQWQALRELDTGVFNGYSYSQVGL